MIDEKVRKQVKESFGIDIIDEVLLANDYHIVFCFDVNQMTEAELFVVSGNIGEYGLDKNNRIFVRDVLPYIEYDNPVSYVIGKDKYLEYLFNLVKNSDEVSEIYFPIKSNDGTVWVVCNFQIIKEDKQQKIIFGRVDWMSRRVPDAIKYYRNTYRDVLTQLYSREALEYHLHEAQNASLSYGLYFDIDNFKRINDIFGHKAGDAYLHELGEKFVGNETHNVHFYRIGGDEFFVYMINSTEQEAYKLAIQIIYDVEKLNPQGEQAEVSAAVGIVPIIGSDFVIDDLLDMADRTMYHAKSKGKGNISHARDV